MILLQLLNFICPTKNARKFFQNISHSLLGLFHLDSEVGKKSYIYLSDLIRQAQIPLDSESIREDKVVVLWKQFCFKGK